MGKVLVTAKIESLEDWFAVERGWIVTEKVRGVVVHDAVVDTRETSVSLPRHLITQLGLTPCGSRPVRTPFGSITRPIYPVHLTIQERDCTCDVTEAPDDSPVVIGLVPLGLLDFVIDPDSHKLIGNLAHNGEWVLELYYTAHGS